jgi:outer membrane lipoprotein-sorting protein
MKRLLIACALTLSVVACAQGANSQDARALLKEVTSKYENPTSIYLEASGEGSVDSEMLNEVMKSSHLVAIAPGSHFRYEVKDWNPANGWMIVVGDGTMQWTAQPWRAQYSTTELSSSQAGANAVERSGIQQMQAYLKRFANINEFVESATLLPAEAIQIGKERLPCTVLLVKHFAKTSDVDYKSEHKLWIDPKTKLIRKYQFDVHHHSLNQFPGDTSTRQVETFLIATTSAPPLLFNYAPPATYKKVDALTPPGRKPNLRLAVGTPAPPLDARTVEGKELSLESLRGKPVLVYFWATWCARLHRGGPDGCVVAARFRRPRPCRVGSERR